jgi:glycosyltransferase involved in cell wall biosynthesis
MRVIVQIPCFNEAGQLALTVTAIRQAIASLPHADGRPLIWELLVIDDGSSDGTALLARDLGVDHVVSHGVNRGLATAFQTGLSTALALGADVIVNTDADNQYDARDLLTIVTPVLAGEADIVVGARPISDHEEFGRAKKLFQRLGSHVVRLASKTSVADAPSGYRAISRHAALRINIFDPYTYTLESIIQAGLSGLRVVSVPVRVNAKTRDSRLVRNNLDYILRSLRTIMRTLMVYRAEKLLLWPAVVLFVASGVLFGRWIWLWIDGTPRSHVPSLVAASMLFLTATQLLVVGYISFLNGINRRLAERLLAQQREQALRLPPG